MFRHRPANEFGLSGRGDSVAERWPFLDQRITPARRQVNRAYTRMIAACVVVLIGSLIVHDGTHADDRPNIVLILGDDQAWSDYGFMKHPDIETPNLDKLAASGLVFPRGYVASPLCRPSLASIVTGRFPFEHGVTGNDVDGRNNRAELDVPMRKQFHAVPSFVRSLTAAGYVAHQSGKWWEGSYKDGGFTHGMTHGNPARGGRHGDAGLAIGRRGMEPIEDFIDDAVEAETPFFVWYAPFLPHTPHNPPPRLLQKYTQPDRASDVAKYYAMCEWFDETCGTLLRHLDEAGVTENTLVLFLCDNGWAATSTNASDPQQSQWSGFALRSKGSPYENGIRTPFLVSWPGQIEPGVCDDLAHSIDLYPTIADAAGLEPPDDLPGINLMDADVRQARHQVFGVTHSIHNMTVGDPDDTQQYLWTVTRRWKLIERFNGVDTTNYKRVHSWDQTPVHLYDIQSDPSEQNNLADQYPDRVDELKQSIADWRE